MIRHGYSGCMPCHTDPSGGAGALTEYGRAQSDLLLRMRYGAGTETGEADRTSGFLWGLVPVPADVVRAGGDFREGFFSNQPEGATAQQQLLTMRADLYADVRWNHLRAAGSIGYVPQGDLLASITPNADDNFISREYWLGYELDEDGGWLLRAGRIALPFGVRMIEHTLWARSLTRTDIDSYQQDGVALSFVGEGLRGEVMAIAGNYQIRPDYYRERGYSLYAEYAVTDKLAIGGSSLFTRATRDIVYGVTDYRYANGPFVRYAPFETVTFMAEADSVYQSLTWNGHRGGFAGFVQMDYEPVQGFHFMLTGETMNSGTAGEPNSYDGWVSAVWFALPHVDLRIDGIYSVIGQAPNGGAPASTTSDTSWLAQVHVFL